MPDRFGGIWMTRSPLLVTGFNAFDGSTANPTQMIVEGLRGSDDSIIAEVLPTEFARAGQRVRELISVHRPDVYLGFGLCAATAVLRLETTAINWMEATIPDNAGHIATGERICPGRADSIRTTIPLEEISVRLSRNQVAHEFSDSAGRFVCNHVFYCAGDEIDRLNLHTRHGFIHVPWATKLGPRNGCPSMPMARIGEAVRIVIGFLQNG
jgi:pyroglutamyl-peptidase